MDFLLSYRLFERKDYHHQSKSLKSKCVYDKRTNFINFLLLSVDNGAWEFLQIQGIFFRFLITTFNVGFHRSWESFDVRHYISAVLDLFYLIDLISAVLYRIKWPKSKKLNEKSSALARIVWKNNKMHPRKIWMIILDVITVLPLSRIAEIWLPFDSTANILLYCLPALRVYRIAFYYAQSSKSISFRTYALLRLIIRVGIFWALATHTFACIWGYLSRKYPSFSVKKFPFEEELKDRPFEWYIVITYFIQIGFTNIGFGDVTPETNLERGITTIIILLGFAMLCGYLIAALSSVLTEKSRRLFNLHLRISLMIRELAQKRVPDNLTKKIVKFYHSLWANRKGIAPENDMLEKLPDSFITQVDVDMFISALNASLLFTSCDIHSKQAIAKVMKIQLFMAGDVILKRREINSNMFFIRKGTIQIMSYQDDETEIMTFGAGTVFGQVSLLLSLPTKSAVYAATFCEIQTLARISLFDVLKDYPSAKEIIFKAHKNLLLNAFADKYKIGDKMPEPENILTTSTFYKVPVETSKLGRDDICIVTTCPYVFMPDTVFLLVWDIMIAIIITIISFYYPYCAAFLRKYPNEMEPFIVVVDCLLWCNIYLSFSTAFVRENIIFSSLRDIISNRMETIYAYIDIASMIPVHYFMHNESRMKSVALCFRCFQFYKIYFLFKKLEYTAGMTSVFFLRLVKYVLYFLIGAYIMGVIYYMQACFYETCLPDSWYMTCYDIVKQIHPAWVSLYFATLVMTGTGFGDITIGNMRDVYFILAFCLFGVLLFIYLIADYSSSLSLSQEPRQNFIELSRRVNSFLLSEKMLTSERTRVRQYLNLQWERNMGYDFESQNNIFFDTPLNFLYEASQFTKSQSVHKLRLFSGMGTEIIGYLLNSAVFQMFPPHEVVVYAGDICNYLLIIEEGFCEVIYGKDVSVKKIYRAGQDICTVELMLGLTAMCHVRTLTHCTIMKIHKISLKRALALNPLAAKELQESITEFESSEILRKVRSSRPVLLHLTVRTIVEKSLFRFHFERKQRGNQELKLPFLKLGLCQGLRFILQNKTVLPYGKLLRRWEISRCCFAFLSAIFFPCMPFFQLEFPFLYYLGVFLDITAFIDLYFRCHVCFYNKRNLLVSHPLYTCSHYIKGNFILDFIFCFPFDRILYRTVYDQKGETFVTTHSIDLLRMLRVGQAYRIPSTLIMTGVDFLSMPNLFWVILTTTALTTIYIGFFTSILTLMSCVYKVNKAGKYRIILKGSAKTHFEAILKAFNFTTDPSQVFILNFYWTATTAFSVGFGDIKAETKDLMIFVIVVIVISYLYFNYVTVFIASYLSSGNKNLTMYQKEMANLISFLKAENVEPLLRKHIVNHFEYTWKKNKGMKAQLIFETFNMSLKNDVMYHLFEETIKEVSAFVELDSAFHRLLCSELDEIHFQSGASIYKPGDIIQHVYFVHSGEVTLVGKDEDHTIELGKSRVFGLIDNVEYGSMMVSAVATKNVSILVIETQKLYQLLEAFLRGNEEDPKPIIADVHEKLLKSGQTKEKEADDQQNLIKKTSGFHYFLFRYSKFIMVFYVLLSLFSANITTYDLAFQYNNSIIFLTLIPTEFFFALKIFLGFHTGYRDVYGEFVSDRRQIRLRVGGSHRMEENKRITSLVLLNLCCPLIANKSSSQLVHLSSHDNENLPNYMRTAGFYFDLFTVIPFEIFALLARKEDQSYVIGLLRITKILRLYHVWYFFNLKLDTLSVNMLNFKILAVGVWAGTLFHQCSCIWFLISCPRGKCKDSATWRDIISESQPVNYLNSLYFIATVITTTGFGDITPHTLYEIIYITTLYFVSFFYKAIFIGQMVSTGQKYLFAKNNYEFMVEGLENYLYVNDISYETRKCVLKYVENLWENEKGQQIPDLLKKAPSYLNYEIKYSTYGHHINNNLVFQKCDPNFRKQLIKILRRTVFFNGNIIAFEGEVNRTAYFVHSGQVEARDSNNKNSTTRIYVEGNYFGLLQCIKQGLPHTYTYFARTSCIILSLNLQMCKYLPHFFPDDLKYISKEIETTEKEELEELIKRTKNLNVHLIPEENTY